MLSDPDAFDKMNSATGLAQYNYQNCGRTKVLTVPLRKWVISRLLALRKKSECTSYDLQRELAKNKKVSVHVDTIRKALHKEGYKYLKRVQKPKYNKEERETRVAFANKVLAISQQRFLKETNFCMDGVVLITPPTEKTARENFCRSDITKVWRKSSEGVLPELQGFDKYAKQAPKERVIGLWGGVSANGFAPTPWHDNRKTDTDEWHASLVAGELRAALRQTNPHKQRGPWQIICDNEGFLRERKCQTFYARHNITLWKLPPRSPDLNPVEKMWGWLRKRFRAMDLADLAARRPVFTGVVYL